MSEINPINTGSIQSALTNPDDSKRAQELINKILQISSDDTEFFPSVISPLNQLLALEKKPDELIQLILQNPQSPQLQEKIGTILDHYLFYAIDTHVGGNSPCPPVQKDYNNRSDAEKKTIFRLVGALLTKGSEAKPHSLENIQVDFAEGGDHNLFSDMQTFYGVLRQHQE